MSFGGLGISQPAVGAKAARLGRSDMSALGRWFWEIDKLLLILVAVLISIGLVAVAAASPAAAQRYSGGGLSFPPLYYFYRQLVWTVVAVPVLIGVSMLPKSTARRLSIAGAVTFTILLFLVPMIGQEVNGARRWIGVGFTQFQPSEFLKPLFIVSIAWLLSLKERDASLPMAPLTAIITGVVALLLMQQPNFGETIIFVAAWALLLTLSGAPLRIWVLGVAGLAAVILAYFFYPVAPPDRRLPVCRWRQLRSIRASHPDRGRHVRCGPGAGAQILASRAAHRLHLLGDRREFSIMPPRHRLPLHDHRRAGADPLLHEEDKFLVLATAGPVCRSACRR